MSDDDDDNAEAERLRGRPHPPPIRAYEPRLTDELRDTPFYKLDWFVRIDLLSRLFVKELDYNKRRGGYGAAYRALDGFCSVSRENREICRKSGEFLHGLLGPQSGPGKMRDVMFHNISVREFDWDFPGFADRRLVDVIYGKPTWRQMEFTRPELPWEKFFEEAYESLNLFLENLRVGFLGWRDIFDHLLDHFGMTTSRSYAHYTASTNFPMLYSSLLHTYKQPITFRFNRHVGGQLVLPRIIDSETISGAELARRALRAMLLRGESISALVKLDGTLFDGREVYTAVVEEGGQFEAFVKGKHTYPQVRAAFFQSPDKRMWLPFLHIAKGDPFEDDERAADRIQIRTLMFLVHQLSEANILHKEATIDVVKEYMEWQMWKNRANDDDDAWAVNLFFSRTRLPAEEVVFDVRRARNLENVKNMYRNNDSSELWRRVLADRTLDNAFQGWVWVARQLWERQQLPADELRSLISRDVAINPYLRDELSREDEWFQEMRRALLPN